MSRNGRVLIAMSGGVDSSVAAALLREQGYDAVGVFMRLGTEHGPQPPSAATHGTGVSPVDAICGTAVSPVDARRQLSAAASSLPVVSNRPDRARGCCSASDAADARSVAARLNIPFYAVNFKPDFQRLIDDFADEYARGRTPNPCVRCNQWLKFGRLAEYADAMDCEFIATGHYAVTRRDAAGVHLHRATDRAKDQSYVLFGVPRDVLARTLFPLGDMSKDRVREQARLLGLDVHDKPDSQDICFVPDRDYARVVRARRPDALRPGDIRHVDGRVVGRHEGVATLTVGQRRGLDVALGERVYVTSLDAETDTVWVGPRESLAADGLIATDVNWLREVSQIIECGSSRGRKAAGGTRASVQIRYHHEPAQATITPRTDASADVQFDHPVEAITPGQAAVFYNNDEVLGGGWIDRAITTLCT